MSPRVAIVGAGPGGIAAARRLRDRAGDSAEILLFEREPEVEYLPATIPIVLGSTPRERWRARLSIPGVQMRYGDVERVSGNEVQGNAGTVGADFVIAAPGLALDARRVPDAAGVCALWDPPGAQAVAEAVNKIDGGTVAVVISSLPYRCPPAPFGLAMELAAYYRDTGREVRVLLATPEQVPLAAVGGGVPEFLERSCAEAGVELMKGFDPDLYGLADGKLRFGETEFGFDFALVIPPHARSPLLARLPGDGPLLQVSRIFESAESGLFVVGDAAMAPLPRAADAAATEGCIAADAVLERLGLLDEAEPHSPQPECYVGHGGGRYSRISLRYPDGLPPAGGAEVEIEGPSEELAAGFEESFLRWRALRDGSV